MNARPRTRFVKVTRIPWKDGYVSYRYCPVELRNGNLYELGGTYGEREEAFKVIETIEARELAVVSK